MHYDAARAGAALTGGPDRAEDDRSSCKIEIGIFSNNDGVVPAQLENRASKPARDRLGDMAADLGRACERYQLNSCVIEQQLANLGSAANNQIENASETVIRHDLIRQMLNSYRSERDVGGGFPNN